MTSDPGTEDPTPLTRLIGTIASRGVDAVAFTSAAATTNLLRVAERGNRTEMLRALASDVLVACVGPVTAAPFTARGIPVVQPERFRLGALVKTIVDELPARRRRTVCSTGRRIEIRGQAVKLDGTLIPIAAAGISLLRKLAEQPGRVGARDELLLSLPGGGSDGHAVEVAIGRLRASLDDPRIVETVVKRGYRLST